MEIQGFSDYLIYPDGRVFSKKSNKYMKTRKNNSGYHLVDLYYDIQKKNSHLIHRLVAIHYIPNPDNLNEVDHINRIKDDNRVENLRWATRKENSNNTSVNSRNLLGFKYIRYNEKAGYVYRRKYCAVKSCKKANGLSKMLCYSFFYILKLSNQ